jgi:hypothetical protein
VPIAQSEATPYPAVLSDSGMLDAETIETKHLAKKARHFECERRI